MYSSENIHTVTMIIDVDPTADGKKFPLMRAAREITVKASRLVVEQTQNAGTAIKAQLEVWTAGTAVAGTVGAAVGGTSVAARLTLHTPAAMAINSTYKNISEGDWLYIGYNEEGTGWISGDRMHIAVDYVNGIA